MTPTTKAWLEALAATLRALDDPNAEIKTNDSYEWKTTTIKGIGRIPKITFTPYGRDTRIKARIMKRAGLTMPEAWAKEKERLRLKYGAKTAHQEEDRQLANRFAGISRKYWTDIKRSLIHLKEAQKHLGQDAITLLLEEITPGYQATKLKHEPESNKQQEKSYAQELQEV